jgi:hypothetical protein
VMDNWTARFPGTVVTVRRRGPDGGDGRADGAIPERDGGGGQGGDSVVPERDGEAWADGMVPRRGNNVEAVGVVASSKKAWEILAA